MQGSGPDRDRALARLHALLLRVARSELRRREGRHPVTGPELDDLAHQAADDALVAVIAKLGRHFWQRPATFLGTDQWERLPDRLHLRPDQLAEQADLLAALRQAVEEHLTDRQRRVFTAIVVDGIPLDALVVQLGSNRNAIYKTMFEARRKLRAALVANGYLAGPDGGPAGLDSVRRSS